MAYNYGLLGLIYGLLYGIVACFVLGYLAFQVARIYTPAPPSSSPHSLATTSLPAPGMAKDELASWQQENSGKPGGCFYTLWVPCCGVVVMRALLLGVCIRVRPIIWGCLLWTICGYFGVS